MQVPAMPTVPQPPNLFPAAPGPVAQSDVLDVAARDKYRRAALKLTSTAPGTVSDVLHGEMLVNEGKALLSAQGLDVPAHTLQLLLQGQAQMQQQLQMLQQGQAQMQQQQQAGLAAVRAAVANQERRRHNSMAAQLEVQLRPMLLEHGDHVGEEVQDFPNTYMDLANLTNQQLMALEEAYHPQLQLPNATVGSKRMAFAAFAGCMGIHVIE